jgi:hypothetical protein
MRDFCSGAYIATKIILVNIKNNAKHSFGVVIRFIASIIILMLIANLGFAIYIQLVEFVMGFPAGYPSLFSLGEFMRRIAFPLYNKYHEILGQWTVHTIIGVFLCSTLVGSLWVGIFGIAAILANFVMRIKWLGPWLKNNFHVERNPLAVMRWLVVIFLFAVCGLFHLGGLL